MNVDKKKGKEGKALCFYGCHKRNILRRTGMSSLNRCWDDRIPYRNICFW